ncbi:VOC family protein [Halalkalibacillus halophilus]|uniref:VOC family protein n=1 Tax=Halalkalibacillus halophilus TaxID=392827 RepID=UPI0004185C99|nr:VOC family protein [Halalkalibacillus halophilus]
MIHHIEIYVSNLEKSIAFWGWLLDELGYSTYQSWEDGRSFKMDQTYLVFVQAEEKYLDVPYHRKRVGLNHLAFQATSTKHVDQLTEEIKRRKHPILYETQHPYAGGPEHYAVYCEDPDRMKVEIVAPSK